MTSDLPLDDDASALLQGTPGLLGLLDAEGIVLDANRAALELIGCRLAEVAGTHFAETPWFCERQDRESVRDAIARAAGGRTQSLLVRHPAAGGGHIDVELTLTPIRGADGRVRRIVPAGRDLSDQREAERRGHAAERTLANLLSVTADAIVSIDADSRIRLFNRGAEALFGYSAADVVGERLEMLLPESARATHAAHVASFGAESPGSRFMNQRRPVTGRRRDGRLFQAEATIARQSVDGEVFYTAVVRDLTERLRIEQELERSRQYTSAIVHCVDEGIVGVDRQARVVFVNPAALRLLGYAERDLLGQALHPLMRHPRRDGRTDTPQDCPIAAALRDAVALRCDDDVYRRADGTAMDVEYTVTPLLHDGRPEGAIVVFRDVSERRAAEARLRDLAEVDELTGLLNRRGFLARARSLLDAARAPGGAVTLAMIDVDGFKPINDRFGHLAGDDALRELAALLRAELGPEDIAARFGGDEFVVLLAGTPAGDRAAALRRRLSLALDGRNGRGDRAFALRVSMGASASPGATDLDALILEADDALYAAKRAREPRSTAAPPG